MKRSFRLQLFVCPSDNRKSKIQNRKLVGIVALIIAFAMCGAVATAQQPKKVPRIGYLSPADPASDAIRAEAILLALRKRGYIEGQDIVVEYRYAEGKRIRYPELAAELVRLKVDVIVVAGADPLSRRRRMQPRRSPLL